MSSLSNPKHFIEIPQSRLRKIRLISFDVDGVCIQTGTKLRENFDGTKFRMDTNRLSSKFVENLKILKQKYWINVSSGRNMLYLTALFKDILWDRVSLQAENGNVTMVEGKMKATRYSPDYFERMNKIRLQINTLWQEGKPIKGYEPKLFITTAHTSRKIPEIPKMVEEIGGSSFYCQWTNEGYDVGHRKANKGVALRRLCKDLGVQEEEVITTGNNVNDIEMLRFGTGITCDVQRAQAPYCIEENGMLGAEQIARFFVNFIKGQ